jgi:hypothetical protein
MPFGWAAAAAAVGTIASSAISASAAGDAANAQVQASQNSNATQLQMYNTTRSDQAPWRAAGGQAVNALSQWYGLGGVNSPSTSTSTGQQGYDPSSGRIIRGDGGIGQLIPGGTAAGTNTTAAQQPVDYNKLLSSLPGYQFQMDQGNQAVQRNLAATGLLQSGAAGKALQQYGQGVASDYAGQYVNGLQSLAGLGQTSVANTGAIGANTANQIGSNQIYAGNAQASGYAGTANAINSGLSGLSGIYGQYNAYQNMQPNYNSGSYASVMNNGNFGASNSYGSGYTFADYGATP